MKVICHNTPGGNRWIIEGNELEVYHLVVAYCKAFSLETGIPPKLVKAMLNDDKAMFMEMLANKSNGQSFLPLLLSELHADHHVLNDVDKKLISDFNETTETANEGKAGDTGTKFFNLSKLQEANPKLFGEVTEQLKKIANAIEGEEDKDGLD